MNKTTGDSFETRQFFRFSISGSLAFGNGIEPVYDSPSNHFIHKLKPANTSKVFISIGMNHYDY